MPVTQVRITNVELRAFASQPPAQQGGYVLASFPVPPLPHKADANLAGLGLRSATVRETLAILAAYPGLIEPHERLVLLGAGRAVSGATYFFPCITATRWRQEGEPPYEMWWRGFDTVYGHLRIEENCFLAMPLDSAS